MAFDTASDPPSKGIADERGAHVVAESGIPRGRAAWFGGPNVRIGPRIAPIVAPIGSETAATSSSDLSNAEDIMLKQKSDEENCAIQYRTCSWQKVRLSSWLQDKRFFPCRPDGSQGMALR